MSIHRSISTASLAVALLVLGGCRKDEPDAYGNFEASEVVVSAEGSGRLLRFEARQGEPLAAGTVVALIDTTTLGLQTQELASQQAASLTRTREAEAQIGVLQAQLQTAREEHARTLRLFRAEAATAQQLNLAEGEVRVLEQRIRAAQAQVEGARQEVGGVQARTAQVQEQIRRAQVVNPAAGTVLTTYAEPGEFVQPGQPLYKIADLRALTLRAYVSGAQLAAVRLGQRVTVQVDGGDDARIGLPGTVTWISSEAEFTPTPIQTRDERTEQVYAVKVRVANPDGVLKIGMPGEVVLPPAAAPAKRAGAMSAAPASTEPAVSVQALSKRFGETLALDGISFDVRPGELFGFIGPDGAGKTTLFRILTTLLVPDEGEARVLGLDVVRDLWALRVARGLHARPLLALPRPERGGEPALLRLRLRDDDRGALSTSSPRSTGRSSRSRTAAPARSPAG